MGQELDSTTAFVTISVVNLISTPIHELPMSITHCFTSYVSMKRIEGYLGSHNIEIYKNAKDMKNDIVIRDVGFCMSQDTQKKKLENQSLEDNSSQYLINQSFSSNDTKEMEIVDTQNESKNKEDAKQKSKDIILKGINIQIQNGKFVAIIGKVGSGKSSLLNALIGEMYTLRSENSEFHIKKPLAFCGGHEYKVLNICALIPDLKVLPSGDLTAVGEKGINLSGGQKARVSLARAVYSRIPIILLDDPISSLDIFSTQKILHECLLGELKTKTRILVTHHLDILPYVDYIYVMDKGQIIEHGTYEELSQNENSFYKTNLSISEDMTRFQKQGEGNEEQTKLDEKKSNKLEIEEDRVFGRVKFQVYRDYFKYAGGLMILVLLFVVFTL